MTSEWRTLTVEDLVRTRILAPPIDGNHGEIHPKAADFVEHGVPFIMASDMKGGRVDTATCAFISAGQASSLRKGFSRPGDVLLSHKATIGRTAIVEQGTFEFLVLTPQVTYYRVLDSGTLNNRYLKYYFDSEPFQQTLAAWAGAGSTRAYLGITAQRKPPIVLPPVATQNAIATTIGVLDDRIALLRETNATLEAIAQALFKSWFVDFDPVRAKQQGLAPAGMEEATAALFPDRFVESAFGPLPNTWEYIDLVELTKRFGGSIQTGPFGSQLHASDYVETGVPVVMPKDISNRRATTESIARIAAADADRLSRHKLQAGDIVFSRRGDVERHALITEREVGWLCGTGCLLLRPGRDWKAPGFLSMLLDAPRARTWLVQHAVGATMPNLNTGILGSVPVVLPSPEVLIAFESVVSVTEEQRSRNATMAETLTTLRDTLLPRLISGQLRLPEAEALALA